MKNFLHKYSFSIVLFITCIVLCPFLFKEMFLPKSTQASPDFSQGTLQSESSDISEASETSEVSEVSETSETSENSETPETSTGLENSDVISSDTQDVFSQAENSFTEQVSSSAEEETGSVNTEPSSQEPEPSSSEDDVYSEEAPPSKIDAYALFIGDSRTVGIREYGYVPNAFYFASVGMSSYGMFYMAENVNGEYLYLETALKKYNFQKIYVATGLNDMGGSLSAAANQYAYNVSRIRELQPEAAIYVQALLHVSKNRSLSDATFNNPAIDTYNSYIAAIANGVDIIYLDANPYFDDGEGNMASHHTSDGIHFYAADYAAWGDWIASSTMN